MLHWLATWTGLTNAAGPIYSFWSGFGSDLGEVALLGAIIGTYRHHKCTTCWRLAHHKVDGTTYQTCHKHATVEDHKELKTIHRTLRPRQHELLRSKK